MAVLLGRTSAGTTADFSSAGNTAVWQFTAVDNGILAVIKAQTKVANTAGAVRFGIYDDSGGDPGNLLDVADVDSLAAANGTGVAEATMTGGVSIASGNVYWLGWFASADNRNFQGDSGGVYREPLVPANFPDPWPADGSSSVDAIIWGEDSGAGGSPDVKTLATLGVG